MIVIANTSTMQGFQGEVIVDYELNPAGNSYKVLYSNKQNAGGAKAPGAVVEKSAGSVTIVEINGARTSGPARVLSVDLQPIEIQILGQ